MVPNTAVDVRVEEAHDEDSSKGGVVASPTWADGRFKGVTEGVRRHGAPLAIAFVLTNWLLWLTWGVVQGGDGSSESPQSVSSFAGMVEVPSAANVAVETVGGKSVVGKSRVRVPAGEDLAITGWAFDAERRRPGKAVIVVVGGAEIRARYDTVRTDVARFYKSNGLRKVGFRAVIRGSLLTEGEHQVSVLLVRSDGDSFAFAPTVLTATAS